MIATSIVGILFAAYIVWHYTAYNRLVAAKIATEQAWSNVEVELKRRLDLIGNLVEVVKGYAKHEGEALQKTVAARNLSNSTGNAEAATDSAGVIKRTLSQLFVLAEAYPDLKANDQFLTLQKELSNTENRISERRHAYNQTVSRNNNLCHSIPSNIIAHVHDMVEQAFFDIPPDEAQKIPTVKF